MASSSKKRTTMAKLNRERALIERRQEKAARKAARKLAAASPAAPSEAPAAESDSPRQSS
jgi:uncharacterized protein HemY